MVDCPKCGEQFNALRDICLDCQWHILKNRPATAAELQTCVDDIDCSIADLEVFLGRDITRDDDAGIS